MGLTSFTGKTVRKGEVATAKNYLSEDELSILGRLVTMFLDFAETRALRREQTTMADWVTQADRFIVFNEFPLLHGAGTVRADVAKDAAHAAWAAFDRRRRAALKAAGEREAAADAARELRQERQSQARGIEAAEATDDQDIDDGDPELHPTTDEVVRAAVREALRELPLEVQLDAEYGVDESDFGLEEGAFGPYLEDPVDIDYIDIDEAVIDVNEVEEECNSTTTVGTATVEFDIHYSACVDYATFFATTTGELRTIPWDLEDDEWSPGMVRVAGTVTGRLEFDFRYETCSDSCDLDRS